MEKFNLLPQTHCVENLLQAAAKALPFLVDNERQELETAIRAFETTLVPTSWSPEDFESYLGECTDDEARAALVVFYNQYEIHDIDWARVEVACETYLLESTAK